MQSVRRITEAEEFFRPAVPPQEVMSSAPYGWHGTLAVDAVGTPTGELRKDHQYVSLQHCSQVRTIRPLQGPGGWQKLEPGARVWLPGERQYFEWQGSVRNNVVFLTPERIEEILETPRGESAFAAWRGLHFWSSFVSQILNAMSEDIANDCPAGPIVGDSLTTALVAFLDAGPEQLRPCVSGANVSAQSFARLLDFIEANIARPLRVAELAREVQCSPKLLSRAFRGRTGLLPHQYVLHRRVEQAKALIGMGQLSLAAVALEVGFADQSQMTKVFAKVGGTTPGQYRRRLRGRQ